MLSLSSFDYQLPEARIAKFPVSPRDSSQLIRYKAGAISHHHFYDLPELLPANALMVFNNTKVIPARLFFQNQTGAKIEVFMLEPILPVKIVHDAMQITASCTWQCLIGNLKKWRGEDPLHLHFDVQGKPFHLQAHLIDRDKKWVTFSWEPSDITVAAWMEALGDIPLPPYLNREAVPTDRETYQTIYSLHKGAVAAPTAGLHFTPEVLSAIEAQGIASVQLTLHVGAGTFLPVKVEDVTTHAMHKEQMVFEKSCVEQLANHEGPLIPVGTTSMRSLESLYWLGYQCYHQSQLSSFNIDSQLPYTANGYLPHRKEAMQLVLRWMDEQEMDVIHGDTGIFIYPGYQFKVCQGLITNFHQPKSTLVMLIAAFMGEDWRRLYEEALSRNYRFLSYGDSCLLLP